MTQGRTWDVVVMGGGLAGVAAAAEAARDGLKVLLLERRPVLGWEICWAHAPSLADGGGLVHRELVQRLTAAGALREGRPDPAISELILDEIAERLGLDVLYYAQPIRLITRDGLAIAVVAATKGGQLTFGGRTFVDATEYGLFWSPTAGGSERPTSGLSRFSTYLWVPRPLDSEQRLGNIGDARHVCLSPGAWTNAVELSFLVQDASISRARCLLPEVLRAARPMLPPEAIVTHTAPELLPLGATAKPTSRADPHPAIRNLFGAGLWRLGATDPESIAGALTAAGAEAGRAAAAARPDIAPLPEVSPMAVVAPPRHECEILVAGGGTAGALAALAAARRQRRVTLLEAGTALDGIATMGGIHIYCVGLPGGLQDEVDARVAALSPLFAPTGKAEGFHPDAKKVALEIMLHEAGVDVRYGTLLVGAVSEQVQAVVPADGVPEPLRHVREAVTASAEGSATWAANVFVDATGDADLAAWAGARCTFGREGDGLPHAYSLSSGRIADGRMVIINFDAGYTDPTDPADLTRARREALKLYRRDRFTDAEHPTYIAPLIGLRSSRQVICDYMLTLADQVAGARFPDAIAESAGFHDNHGFDYEFESDASVFYVWVLGYWGRHVGCEIPYRVLLPRGVEGVLVACRAAGLTHDAHMSFRMQNDMQRLGEAAGLAAALAVEAGVTPRAVDVRALQSALIASGGLRPPSQKPRFIEKREEALGHLRALPPPEPAAEFVKELDGPRSSAALLALSGTGRESSLYAELARASVSEKPAVRFRAAAALAMHRDPQAIPALIRAVTERQATTPTPEGRATRADVPAWIPAMVLLGRLRAREAVPALTGVLEDRAASFDAILTAVRSLGRIGDPRAIPALERVLNRTDIEATRRLQVSSAYAKPSQLEARWQLDLAVAEALAVMGASRRDLAAAYLEDPRAPVRRRASAVSRLIEESERSRLWDQGEWGSG
jgi:hypothetical protein